METMPFDIAVSAPAKVNIGLAVLPKAAGEEYHRIESIFQTIDVCDELFVRRTGKNGVCSVRCDAMALPQSNTITKAYERFRALSGIDAGFEVVLKKNIPSGGGLGGGSSDAASFVKAIATLLGFELTDSFADSVAEKVGSDVFFFLRNGLREASLVSGRGEIVKKINARHDFHFVLIFPEVFSSTKEAYALLDTNGAASMKNQCPLFDEYESIYSSSVENWTFINSFTSVLTEKYPAIRHALQDLKNQGALWADMSGSGATVFGIFESSDSAAGALALLRKKWRFCYYSRS